MWLVRIPRGHRGRSAQVEPTQRGHHNYATHDWGSSTIFVGLAAVGAIMPPREHQVTLVSMQGHTISSFTEVICIVILSIRAIGLFFKPSLKSTSVALRMRVVHRVCLVQANRVHRGRSASVEPARRGQHNYVTPGRDMPTAFFGPMVVELFLSPRMHRPTLVSMQGGSRFQPS